SGRGVETFWLPGRAASPAYGPYPDVAAGKLDLAGFVSWFRTNPQVKPPLDISPCRDDRPFVLDLNTEQPAIFKQLAAFTVALSLILAALGWRARSTDNSDAAPAESTTESGENATPRVSSLARWIYTAYFASLGIGFMLVEIPLAQKLILPLGYPTLALTVILFSILLGGGIGSWFSQRFEGATLARWGTIGALGVAFASISCALLLDRAAPTLLGMNLTLRCILVGAALLPFGFLLGTPFPSGMRHFSAILPASIPLVWGLNGVASVLGSLGAAMGAKLIGFNGVLMIGAAIYLFAAILLQLANRAQPRVHYTATNS
ncbi:MAG TPA: hypothetical protein VF719_06075, partial [Abditibacteriaceae bacterium]